MIIVYLLGLIVGVVGLVKVTDRLIHLIKIIGHRLGWPTFVVSSIFLAAATSFPELFVGITSSIEGLGELSLGNILGSNLTNVTFILGFTAIVVKGVSTRGKILFNDLREVAVISIAPYLLLIDRELSRIDGVIMILIYAVYLIFLVEKEKTAYRLSEDISHKHGRSLGRLVLRFVIWLIILGGVAQVVVVSAEGIAQAFKVSAFVIGLLLVSLGTSLPELVVGIRSADDKNSGIFFGNILGSMAINSSLILGLIVMIKPIQLGEESSFMFSGILLLIVFLLLPVFVKSRMKLERKEGLALLAIYSLFLIYEILVV